MALCPRLVLTGENERYSKTVRFVCVVSVTTASRYIFFLFCELMEKEIEMPLHFGTV